MTDNVAVKITADVVDLQAKYAVARAEVRAFTNEVNAAAKQIASGGMTDALKTQLQQATESMLQAKNQASALRSELTEGKRSFEGFAQATEIGGQALEAFGVVASIGAMVSFGRSVFDAAEQVYHEAEVLGLSTDAYQAFAQSAMIAGVATDTVDMALRKFNASQGAALSGTGDQAKAFNDLGVSAKLPADEALPAVARSLLSIEDAARRSRDEVALFGRSGEELNPALEQWAQGTDVVLQKLKDLGLYLDPQLLQAAHEAKVEMDTAWGQVDVKWAPAIVKLTQVIGGLASAYASMLDAASRAGDAVGKVFDRGPTGDGGYEVNINPDDVAAAPGHPKPPGPPPKSNWTDNGDAKKAAQQAREIADEIAQAQEQGALRHIEAEQKANDFILELGYQSLHEWEQQANALEDVRYQATLQGLQKRAAADAGDKVKLAKDKADIQQLEQEHVDRLDAIYEQYLTKKKAQDQASLEEFIKQKQDELQAGINSSEQQYQAGKISAQQRHDSETSLTNQIEQEVLKRYDAEHASLTAGTEAYDNAMKERAALVETFTKDAQKADRDLQTADTQSWKTATNQILSAEDQLVSGIFSGRSSLSQSLEQMGLRMVEQEIANDLKYLTAHILFANLGLETDRSAATGGMLVHLLGEDQKTAATVAGETARLTAKQSAQVVGAAQDVAAGSATIANDAYKAASGAYSAVAGIPIVGPVLAPIAAGTAFAAVMAFDTLTSFDVGTNFIPSDMPAMVHQGERIVPKADNAEMMSIMRRGSGDGDGGGDTHYHFHGEGSVGADQKSIERWFGNNSGAIVKALGRGRQRLQV